MHRLRSERTGISYLSNEAENAPLVMCVHGFPDIPRTFALLAEDLRDASYHVVCPWLPGYAPSSLEGPLDSPSVARRILDLIDELSPSEPIRYVGHDWGAVVGQHALAAASDRFRAAALLAVPHVLAILENSQEYPLQLGRSRHLALFQLPLLSERLLSLRDFAYVERLWQRWSPGLDPGDDYFDEVKLCLRSSIPAPLRYYRALKSPTAIRDTLELLQKGPIDVPTLSIHGERDGALSPDMFKGQSAWFSALFEELALADAGHFVHLDRPTEVNEAIVRWFDDH